MGNSDVSKSADPNCSPILAGDKIGMSFNQGDLVHELYGQALNVGGVIPLLCPYGLYTSPDIHDQPEKMKGVIQRMTIEYRSLWEDDLDEEVASKVRDFLLFGAHTNPSGDVTSPEMQTYISVIILIFAIDDLCDQLSDNSSKALKYTDIKKMTHFLVDIFEGVYASLEEMPNPIKAIECANAFIWKSKSLCEENIPDWLNRNEYCKQEWVNVLSTYVLFTENAAKFSETSRVLFGSYQAAVSGYLELLTLIKNISVAKEIREDTLFQRMRQASGSVSNLMNDVFGLERDMKLGQVKDSSILRKVMEEGIPLAEAVNNTVQNLCDEINDVKLCADKLRLCYGEDEDLKAYVQCLEIMLDGQLYWYEHTERYKDSNLKIVKMSN